MVEKTNLKTDQEAMASTILIGTNPISGLQMFRRFRKLYSDLDEKQHRLTFEEWEIALDGKLYEEYYRIKEYVVVDISDPIVYAPFTQWFNQLAPVLLPEIDNTLLKKIPTVSDSGFVITGEIFQNG